MISRRQFLQRIAATAAAMSLEPFDGISAFENIYENRRLSLSVTKPIGWVYASIADFAALRDKQVLEDVLATESHELRDPSVLPVFILENEDYRDGEFLPAICLYDNARSGPPPSDECSAHLNMIKRFSNSYKNLNIVEIPKAISTRNIDFTVADWTYEHVVENISPVPLVVRSLLMFRPERVHTYYLVDHRDEPRISADVWDDFIGSINYTDNKQSGV